REIKFRVRDITDNQMLNVDYMRLDNGNVLYVTGKTFFENDGWFLDNGIELMQYTGLKDKNGTEIYEGDIVKFDPSVQPLGDMPQDGEVGIIKYVLNSFVVVPQSDCSINYNIDEIGDWVVIGNIYENPELLKDKK
ncbi:YopX family protein, partial [Campylobacter mucosalis]